MFGKLGFSFLRMPVSLTEKIPLLNLGSIMASKKLENCTDRVNHPPQAVLTASAKLNQSL